MAGDEDARYVLGGMEAKSRNVEQAANHLRIAESAGLILQCKSLLHSSKKALLVDSHLTPF
jgi:hypothetical protein